MSSAARTSSFETSICARSRISVAISYTLNVSPRRSSIMPVGTKTKTKTQKRGAVSINNCWLRSIEANLAIGTEPGARRREGRPAANAQTPTVQAGHESYSPLSSCPIVSNRTRSLAERPVVIRSMSISPVSGFVAAVIVAAIISRTASVTLAGTTTEDRCMRACASESRISDSSCRGVDVTYATSRAKTRPHTHTHNSASHMVEAEQLSTNRNETMHGV